MFKKISFGIALWLLLLLPVAAQEAVVYGVMFYSPGCRHCHEVLTQHFPKFQAEFGDQLQVLFINIDSREGVEVYHTARAALQTEASGVPMLIIGTHVLVGSVNIPERAPTIIRDGLAAGVIALPAIPGIQNLFDQALAQANANQQNTPPISETAETSTILMHLAADPVANTLAIGILLVLLISLGASLWAVWRITKKQTLSRLFSIATHGTVLFLLALLGFGMALLLVAGAPHNGGILLLASAEAIMFMVIVVMVKRTPSQQPLPAWLLPLMTLAGLGVAAYLAYIEITVTDAVCGVVGNCNTVQQSPYARILDIPVGVWGVMGYMALLLVWFLGRQHRWAAKLLLGMALVGTAFSAYLTFLEPFVIGASCVWCLTSAVWMLMVLWLSQARFLVAEMPDLDRISVLKSASI